MMLIVQLRALFVFVSTRGVAKVNSELQDLCMPCLVILATRHAVQTILICLR